MSYGCWYVHLTLATSTQVHVISREVAANDIGYRVLARILKMPVQNSNSKISTHPDLATILLPNLIPTRYLIAHIVKK